MEPNTITVVCCGPASNPHPRRELLSYHLTVDDDGPHWWLLPPGGIARMALDGAPTVHKVDWPTHGNRIRLRCTDCKFDEKRTLDRRYRREFPPFSTVFDKLREAGVSEISARGLAATAWGGPPQ